MFFTLNVYSIMIAIIIAPPAADMTYTIPGFFRNGAIAIKAAPTKNSRIR